MKTILLVDDNQAFRDVIRDVLAAEGYKVLCAADGNQALEAWKKHSQNNRAPIPLLITDLLIPGMNGLDLARRLSSFHPLLRVLYMSGRPDDPAVQKVVRSFHSNFLPKPIPIDVLLRKVREHLEAPAQVQMPG